MSMDPNKWVNTLPFTNTESNQEKYKLDFNRWSNTLPSKTLPSKTLPSKDDDILILSNAINSNPKLSSGKKYSLTIIGFVVGLILVSVIKNETRNLQKEISNLQASINTLKLDLHQTTLEHHVITSPENISLLANEYLESDFNFYKKYQIKQLNGNVKSSNKVEEKGDKKTLKKKNKMKTDAIKSEVAKKIKITKTELRKLKELYSKPTSIPAEVKTQIASKIKEKKIELKNLYSSPKKTITFEKARNWVFVQVAKFFLGMPIVPGK